MANRRTLEEQIEQAQKELKQKEAKIKDLMQRQRSKADRARNHRLCKRGGRVESLLPGLVKLNDEQFDTWTDKVLLSGYAQEVIEQLSPPEPDETESGDLPAGEETTAEPNEQSKAEEWRAAWADEANAALQEHGINQRIDHRSYERQGVEIIPSIKMGPAASQMERRGIRTDRGDINREIAVTNKEIRLLRARIYYVKNWLADANEKLKSPSLIDVIDELYQREGVSHKTRFNNFVDACNFLMRNKIGDLGQLEDKVDDMTADLKSVQDELRNVERRIDTLNKHIMQTVNYKQYRGYRKHYDRLRADYDGQ